METKPKYKITLSDGTVLDDLYLNGDNFISTSEIAEDAFAGNCSPVIIESENVNEIHDHMDLIQITKMDGDWWFILKDISEEELAKAKMQSDIAYIAMMTNVEL